MTPGSGSYEAKSLDSGLRFSVSKNPRFIRNKLSTDKAPHTFEKPSSLNTIGCGIAKDFRFHY